MSYGGVDPNIPLQAGRGVPPPANPLQTIGEFANVQNALNQNRLFPGQQELQQQAIQSGGIGIQGAQIGLAQKINSAAAQALAPLLASEKGTITHSMLTTAAGSVEHNLGIPTSGFVSYVASDPMGDGPEFDSRVRSWIASNAQTGAPEAVAQVTRGPGPVVTYGGVGTGLPPSAQPTTVNPAGLPDAGVVQAAGQGFPLGLSPGEASTPTQTGVVPQGQPNAGAPVTGTRQQFIEQATGQPSPFGTGRFPSALRNPNGPNAGASAPGTVAAGPPGVVTGMGPSALAAAGTTGTQSAQSFQSISDQAAHARSQASILDTMLGDTSEFTTGAGANGIKDFQNAVQRVLGTDGAKAFGLDPQSVAAHESFDKFAAQLADAQGAGSDARLAVNQHANPASTNTPAGVDFIIRQLRGNTDYLRAQAQLAASYPDKTDVQGFQANVANNLDPRVFQYARMTPQQKVSFYNAMPNKQEFQQAYRFAAQNNLLPAPQGVPQPTAAPSIPTQ